MKKIYTIDILSASRIINQFRERALATTDNQLKKSLRKEAERIEDEAEDLSNRLYEAILNDDGEIEKNTTIEIIKKTKNTFSIKISS